MYAGLLEFCFAFFFVYAGLLEFCFAFFLCLLACLNSALHFFVSAGLLEFCFAFLLCVAGPLALSLCVVSFYVCCGVVSGFLALLHYYLLPTSHYLCLLRIYYLPG